MRGVLVFSIAFLAALRVSDANPGKNLNLGEQVRIDYEKIRADQFAAIAKTQSLLNEKYQTRLNEMKRRVRAIYKLSRGSWPRLWFEPEAQLRVVRWLAAARRVGTRDRDELALLREEIELASAAQIKLEQAPSNEFVLPARGSLLWPVRGHQIVGGFGAFTAPSYQVKLRRRGIEIATRLGGSVTSPAAGQVRYVGGISGLGTAVILDHKEYVSILGHLQSPQISAGDQIERGSVLATAAGERVYLEVRVPMGDIGHPVDPTLLLSRR